jgi:O-antigen/teichoic acid export membrane protein
MQRRFSDLLRRNGLVHSIGILAGGTVAAQAIVALAMPILTRLYSPHDFSLLAVYSSVLGLITVVSCLRFNIAIPLPEEPAEGLNLVLLSLMSTAVVACLTTIPVIFAPQMTAKLLGQVALQPYLWMVPVGVALASSYDVLQYWASRKRQFALIMRTRVVRAVGGVGSQLVLGAAVPSPFGLILGHMLYSGLGVVDLARALWRHDRCLLGTVTRARLLATARYYKRFPLFSVPEALFNTIGLEVSILIIAAAAIGPEAGFLMLAMRVMGLPMALIGNSVAQVFLVEAPERMRAGTLPHFTRRAMLTLFKLGVSPLLLVGLISPWLFPTVFGQEWARAGLIVTWLTPMCILQFVASPVSMFLHVTGRVVWAMWLQIFGGIIRVGCVAIAAWVVPTSLIEVFSITSAVFYLIYLIVIYALTVSDNRMTSA